MVESSIAVALLIAAGYALGWYMRGRRDERRFHERDYYLRTATRFIQRGTGGSDPR